MGVSIAVAEGQHQQQYQEFINSLSGTPAENQP